MEQKNNPDVKIIHHPIDLWNVTPNEAIQIQQDIKNLVKIQKLQKTIKTIGVSDISFNIGSNIAYAVFVVLDFNTLAQIGHSYYIGTIQFPYIPGLLSFREIPLLLEAWKRLKHKPDVVMMDGQGIAHPRRLGIASHFGVLTHTPTLGCAKSRLVGQYQEPDNRANSYSPLLFKNQRVGVVYRTKKNTSPIFASPGHMMNLSDVIQILNFLKSQYRIPEPTRQAHLLANSMRGKFSSSDPMKIFHSKDSKKKCPFHLENALLKVKEAIQPFPKAMLFELAAQGFNSLFQQLIACIISIRTRDEVSLPAALSLFRLGKLPDELATVTVQEIDQTISASKFHLQKAYRIQEIAQLTKEKYNSKLPVDRKVIESLPGIGPKCASLALGIANQIPSISVDVHVLRVTQRWGYIQSVSPHKATQELESKLPKRYWIELNFLLVPFGKHICTGQLPHCSECPLLEMCQQIDVKRHR